MLFYYNTKKYIICQLLFSYLLKILQVFNEGVPNQVPVLRHPQTLCLVIITIKMYYAPFNALRILICSNLR